MTILALLLANTAVLLGASAILRRIRSSEPSTDVVIFLLLRIGLISLAVLVAGVARLLSPTAFAIAGAFGTGVLLTLGEHRHLPRPRLPDVGRGALLAAHRRALKRTERLTARQGFETLVSAGIITPTGKLTRRYGG